MVNINGKNKYIYMKKFGNDGTYCIMYSLGAFHVARMIKKETGVLCYVLRRYKTLSGAERYLDRLEISSKEVPEVFWETEEFIKKGSYWK